MILTDDDDEDDPASPGAASLQKTFKTFVRRKIARNKISS